jgi:hypothetical protein
MLASNGIQIAGVREKRRETSVGSELQKSLWRGSTRRDSNAIHRAAHGPPITAPSLGQWLAENSNIVASRERIVKTELDGARSIVRSSF